MIMPIDRVDFAAVKVLHKRIEELELQVIRADDLAKMLQAATTELARERQSRIVLAREKADKLADSQRSIAILVEKLKVLLEKLKDQKDAEERTAAELQDARRQLAQFQQNTYSYRRIVSEGRPIILVAADILPLYDQSSGGMRLFTLIQMMKDAGWSIIFGSLARISEQPGVLSTEGGRATYEGALRSSGVISILYGLSEIDEFLSSHADRVKYAFLSFPQVASECIPLLRCRCPSAHVIYDMVDFCSLRLSREGRLKGDSSIMSKAQAAQALEVYCAKAADVTIAITDQEKDALLDLVPGAQVKVIPNVFDIPELPAIAPGERKGLLFVGGFWHAPNRDAIIWFVEELFPALRSQIPDIELKIAGANPGEDVIALGEHPGVRVLGYVEDLSPLYINSRVCVAPLRYGAGMKGKVGQSLSYGLPVVTTSIGAEGMGLVNGEHVLIADSGDDFVAAVVQLMRDEKLWSHLSSDGRALVRENYSRETVQHALTELLVD